jgi:LPXTG-motif cell wall-anchored protein
MKKIKEKVESEKSFCCPLGKKIGEKMNKIKEEAQVKAKEVKKYSKENPEKTRGFLAILGVIMMALLTIFISKKRKNKKED